MEKLTSKLLLSLKGMAMGIAEVIPGVSGGTIALITGIYEELIDTIKTILSPAWIQTWREEGPAAAWQKANGLFMFFLLGGMAAGVIFGVFVVSHLLETAPELLWAFFFGLIIASTIYVGRQVGKWSLAEILALIGGAVFAFYITVANPIQGSEALWYVFLCGAIAISALMLPGISGSFILLLMGMYTYIIPMVKDTLQNFAVGNLLILGVFGLGCLVGMGAFSRVLSWTLRHYHRPTMALLAGFMLGSLNKIWPWRNVIAYRENSRGEQVPFLEKSVLPAQYDGNPMVLWVIILMVVGFAAVFLLERLGQEKK